MKSDVLGTMTGCGGDDNGLLHPVGKEAGPTQYLHSTHGTAHDCPQPFDTHIVQQHGLRANHVSNGDDGKGRSEEHTSELQSLMRISYAVFCLKKKKHNRK